MKDKVTVIISIRNRDAVRIKNQVNSIRGNGEDPSFHVVDYGSEPEYMASYEETCKKLGLQYTHIYAEGLPWNKCRALNYGINVAETEYVVTSDVDMIYEGKCLTWCLSHYNDDEFYQIETFWLPKNGDKSKKTHMGRGTEGPFTFFSKKQWEKVRGYDEKFIYWGPEDADWASRLRKAGYSQTWLPPEYKIYHVWHKSLSYQYSKPSFLTYQAAETFSENLFTGVSHDTGNKGLFIAKDMRPILNRIFSNDYIEHVFPHGYFSGTRKIEELIQLLETEKCVKLSIGPRVRDRPLKNMLPFFRKLLKPITYLTGTVLDYNINSNYDYLFVYLPVLMKYGLKDFYISADFSTIYLLWS